MNKKMKWSDIIKKKIKREIIEKNVHLTFQMNKKMYIYKNKLSMVEKNKNTYRKPLSKLKLFDLGEIFLEIKRSSL